MYQNPDRFKNSAQVICNDNPMISYDKIQEIDNDILKTHEEQMSDQKAQNERDA